MTLLRTFHPKRGFSFLKPTGAVLLAALYLALPASSEALSHYERSDWMLGVGMGYGRGLFETPSGREDRYTDGALPAIYFGRMIGQHFMVGLAYEGWMFELGGVVDDTTAVNDTTAVKFRRSLQIVGFSATVFPGSVKNWTGGIYLRATAGKGWAGSAAQMVHIDEPQHNAPRIDEWGYGASLGAGYDFWINRHFTTGLGFTYDFLDLDDQIVDRGRFAGLLLNVNLYF